MFGVLDRVLSKQEWLVGGKPTIADLSFITCVCTTFASASTWCID